MPKVLFLETRHASDRGITYEQGRVYQLAQASANRWLSRGVATTDRKRIAEAEAKFGVVESAPNAGVGTGTQLSTGDAGAPGKPVPPAAPSSGAPVVHGIALEIKIDADWRDLPWPKLRALAAALSSGEAVNSKERAVAIVEAELAARVAKDAQ